MSKPKKNDPNEKDTRGRRKGQRGARRGTTPQPHGGAIGQEPYEPTERDREYVEKHAWFMTQDDIALRLGISKKTLQRHFKEELSFAKTDRHAELGKSAYESALEGDGPMLRFILATKFGWNTKVDHEHSGKGGGPIRTVDLTPLLEGKTEEELKGIEQFLEQLLVAATVDGGSESGSDLGRAATGEEVATAGRD